MIGYRIKKARLKKKYSQEKLGLLVHVSKVSICGYETGTRSPSIDILLNLANALDVDPNYLLGYEVNIVSEALPYNIKLPKEDIRILKEIKRTPELYSYILEDIPRRIEFLNRIKK